MTFTDTTLKITIASLLLASFAFYGTAFAQNADVTGQIDATVLDQTVDADTSASVDMDASVTDDSVQTQGSASTGAMFSLTRDDTSVESTSGTAVSASSVSTQNDLEAYAATTMRDTDAIRGVDVNGDSMRVSFAESVRLFGFIPHTMTSHVEVASDGSVEIKRPWYSFLTAGASTELSADLQSSIRSAIAAEGGFTTRAQAQALGEVATALGGTVRADMNASIGDTINAEVDAALDTVLDVGEEETPTGDSGGTDAAPQ